MQRSETVLLAQVSSAHFVSHLHLMVIPALLPLLPGIMEVGYVEIGLALSLSGIVSALVQAPLGFAVDRFGPRRMLAWALACGSLSFAALALLPTYGCLLAAMAFVGLANGVYHPADYALLSRGIGQARMGTSFSIHTFAGYFGSAVTPVLMIAAALTLGIGWAFAAAAAIGLLALGIVLSAPMEQVAEPETGPAARRAQAAPPRPASVFTPAVAVLTGMFLLLHLSTGGIEKFSVAALIAIYDTPLALANTGLTAFLFASAFGVLAGGQLADRTTRHGLVAAGAFGMAAAVIAVVGLVRLPDIALVTAMGAAGFLAGVVAPSRDMLVRAASPKGAEGRTFGIVSTGFNIGGMAGPVLYALLLDRGLPEAVFLMAVGFMLLTVAVMLYQERWMAALRRKAAAAS